MPSKPSSRRPRASTLAPRSWPSRPGLARSTLMGRSFIGAMIRARGALSRAASGLRQVRAVLLVVAPRVVRHDGHRPRSMRRELLVTQLADLLEQPAVARGEIGQDHGPRAQGGIGGGLGGGGVLVTRGRGPLPGLSEVAGPPGGRLRAG